jgi:hypothetical protein
MSFSIEFLNGPLSYPYDDPTTAAATGLITLGDFKETFESSLYIWSKQDYLSQWQSGLRMLLDGETKSALITEYTGMDESTHLVWWTLYRDSNFVHVQNQLLFFDQLHKQFSLGDLSESVASRRTTNEDGDQLSEWTVTLADIRRFAESFPQ